MIDATFPLLREEQSQATTGLLVDEFEAQRDVAVSRYGTGLVLLPRSYDDRLADLLVSRNTVAASEAARRVADHFGGSVDPSGMAGWIGDGASAAALLINDATRASMAGLGLDEIDGMFDGLVDVQAALYGADLAGGALNFGAHEGARAGGADGKMWQTNSGNPRSAHAALSGETVGLDGTFSNGMRWPKDPSSGAGAAEIAGCQCTLIYV